MPTRSELARIHIAKRDLKLSDPLYRDFLKLWFGKASAKNLTSGEIEELLTHFKGLGWGQVQSVSKGPPLASTAQLYKISKSWMTGPGIRVKTPAALRHFLQGHFHIASLAKVKAVQVGPILGAIRKMAEHASAEENRGETSISETV